jgi:hypothetical protein
MFFIMGLLVLTHRRVIQAIARRDALAHEHARAGGRLEHVVDALGFERGALLVRARADLFGYALGLVARDVPPDVGRVRGWAQVRFAADEEDGDRRTADGSDFFYPLLENEGVCELGRLKADVRMLMTDFMADVVERVGCVDGKCD